MLQGCKVTKTSPALLAHIQPHISKGFCSDMVQRETTTFFFSVIQKVEEKIVAFLSMRSRIWYHRACMVIITGDRIGGGSQLTGGLYQEAQSIHLDRTSKSSLGPRDWSLSRDRLIGSYCCCQGSRSSCKPCVLIMILTNQQHWHILSLCTVTKLCSHSIKGQIVMFKCPSCERVTKKSYN